MFSDTHIAFFRNQNFVIILVLFLQTLKANADETAEKNRIKHFFRNVS
jgi:hypothetical protein